MTDAAPPSDAGAPIMSGSLTIEQQLAVLYSIARAFAQAQSLDEISPLILKTLADAFGWQSAGLWARDEREGYIRCIATYSAGDRLAEWVSVTLDQHVEIGAGLPGRVWETGEPIWINDITDAPGFLRREVAHASGLRHGLAFPIHVRGSVRAVVELFASETGEADPHQIDFLEAVGHQLGSFIERIETTRQVASSEARKTGVLTAAVDAIVSADRAGRIIEFNPAAEALFKRTRADVVGRTIAEIMVPDDLRAAHSDALRRYSETGEARIMGKRTRTWGLCSDGTRVPVELTVTEIRVDGEPMYTAFIRDITRERQAETARERFLELLSHELRTPVTSIYGGAKVLARKSLDPERRQELIDDIGAEADRLYRLVEDLIVLARADRSALPMQLEPVRLDRVAERVLAAFRGEVKGLELRLSQRGPAMAVLGDETYVEQLLRNLLSNAVKYGATEAGIDIELVHADGECIVRVLDRGPGINPDELGRLFEIDYRSPLTEGLAQGSGIGLFVARWLIQGMGGRIWAAPRDGGGSEFGFALPIVDADVPADVSADVVSLDSPESARLN